MCETDTGTLITVAALLFIQSVKENNLCIWVYKLLTQEMFFKPPVEFWQKATLHFI